MCCVTCTSAKDASNLRIKLYAVHKHAAKNASAMFCRLELDLFLTCHSKKGWVGGGAGTMNGANVIWQ